MYEKNALQSAPTVLYSQNKWVTVTLHLDFMKFFLKVVKYVLDIKSARNVNLIYYTAFFLFCQGVIAAEV